MSTLAATFLEFACWDHHIHGKGDHWRADRAAGRLLAQHPQVARHDIYTAVVSGELDEVRRRIAADDRVARASGGSRGWTPLLYLCFTRFTHQATIDNAVAIGRLLLDAGANPNDFYMAGGSRYTALVGAAGEGEQDSPRQPQGAALFELLLERGADPFDIQVLYNTHFRGDVLWWLELIYKHTAGTPRAIAWADPEWRMLDMGNYGTGARFLLDLADSKEDSRLREWLMEHGANSTTTAKVSAKTHGRMPGPLDDMFTAAERDDAGALARLLDAGVPIDIEDSNKQRTLHIAAAKNTLNAARLLIARGAEVDPRETRWHAPPIGFAAHHHHTAMMDLLAPHSREIFNLCANGYVDRVRELLTEEPALAKRLGGGESLLFWLPDDEEQALALADMLLANGADPALVDSSERTPADVARRRGHIRLAARLRSLERLHPPKHHDAIEKFDGLAHDLVLAYDSGFQPALQRLGEYLGGTLTWEDVRREVRRRLDAIPKDELPQSAPYDGYFALPQARLLIARYLAGFDSWEALMKSMQA